MKKNKDKVERKLSVCRTNSQNMHNGSTGKQLTPSLRNNDQNKMLPDNFDCLKVAVFSREASENFAKTYQKQHAENTVKYKNIQSLNNQQAEALKKNTTSIQADNGSNNKNILEALLKDKDIPHVICVIEGKNNFGDVNSAITLKLHDKDYNFKVKNVLEGKTLTGKLDAKQNFIFLVREDMELAFKFGSTTVEKEPDNIPCGYIDYKTDDNKSYRTLLVHTPNKLVSTVELEKSTHLAFQKYHEQEHLSNINVTSYIGDTNYKSQAGKNSLASVGGKSKEGGFTAQSSSGANKFTCFMQGVSLKSELDSDKDLFSVIQPSLLNNVEINKIELDDNIDIDHPSFMSRVGHSSKIKLNYED